MILVWLSLAFVAGVLAGTNSLIPAWLAIGTAVALACGAVVWRRRFYSALLMIAAFALGLARAPHPGSALSAADLAYYNGRSVSVHGVVDAEPDIRDTGVNYVVAVDALIRGRQTVPVTGRIEVRLPRSQVLEYGDAVSLRGRLRQPSNAGPVPYRDVLARRGIGSQMRYPRVLDLGPVQTGWRGLVVSTRLRLERGIDRWLPEPEAALLIAITLGARSATLGDLTPVLIATGLIHIIAISGIKVALVAGMLYQLGRALQSRLTALVFALCGLVGYVLLTGATASGVRSALMWVLIFTAAYLGRGTVALVSLGFATALMVAVDPTLLWDTGFHLTVIGTFAIVALANRFLQLGRWIPSPIREALCVTVAAQIGTLPIGAISFHVVSGPGMIANALVLPLLPLMILIGFSLGSISALPAVAAPLAACGYALLHTTMVIAGTLASVPGIVRVGPVSSPLTVAYYAALTIIAVVALRRANWAPISHYPNRAGEVSLALVVAVSGLTLTVVHGQNETRSRLTWLGTGHALVLRSGGVTALIDGSPRPFQLLERLGQVVPFDQHTIDLVVVTDPGASNVVGLRSVLQHYGVSEVLDVGAEYPSTTYASWREDLRQRHIPTFALRTGAGVSVGNAAISVLGPDDIRPNAADAIGMLRVTVNGRRVLLVGAAGLREQREALFRSIDLRAESLVIDGKQGIDASLVRDVRPEQVSFVTAPGGGIAGMKLSKNRTQPIEK